MQEIDLRSVLVLLLAKAKWIIASIAVGMLLFGSYAYFFVPEAYTASALIYVRNTKEDYEINGTTSGNLSASQQLVANYTVHMKTQPVADLAASKLDGRVSANTIASSSSATAKGETSWLELSTTMNDAQLAIDVCTALADASAATFGDLEASSATIRQYPATAVQTSPNVLRSAVLGALIGLVLSVAIILLRQFTDNAIHSRYDLQSRLDVPVLGEIPSFDMAAIAKQQKGGGTHA